MKRKKFAVKVGKIDNMIAPIRTDKILFYVEVLLSLVKGRSDVLGSEESQRGYLTMMNGKTGEIFFTLPFGIIPKEKEVEYFKLSQEKAKRLFLHNKKDLHTTSYQSRNPEKEKLGGAVYVDLGTAELILSFDGTTELKNEAMMMVLADKLAMDYNHGVITQSEARGRNPFWTVLLHDFVNHKLIVPTEKEMQKVGAQ